MKTALLLALATTSLAACAGPAPMMEAGYRPGTLGVAAIDRQDWAAAEQALLTSRGVREDNPARLINLGQVYMATGRTDEALVAWRRAAASDRHFFVSTMSGEWVSTEQLAERALSRYGVGGPLEPEGD